MMTDTIDSGGPQISGPIRPIKKRYRKLLVVVDGSPESKVAIRFAAARAAHITGGGLILFHCIRPGEFQHWMAVADRMREEAYEEARVLLDEVAERLHSYCGITPEVRIVEGEPKEQLLKFIDETPDIFGLVLGAGPAGNPGPLVDYFAHELAGSLKCPVMLVPGNMTYEQVDEMA
ncbi:universal stress protein [Pseudokordiimonas caeni]|uniref:universal stress protein n=1 Tax=Pseudokordiimonas caeni TaxID=2997908 RepID=UPI002811CF68|nr:universal stress protein [Pseudokordiimonas caeni]